jgi:hypothetical protein
LEQRAAPVLLPQEQRLGGQDLEIMTAGQAVAGGRTDRLRVTHFGAK